jgi:uncharacterized protein
LNPTFPAFKSVELPDRDLLHPRILEYRPDTSEINFTNFYMWRHHYQFEWSEIDGCIVFTCRPPGGEAYGLMPFGAQVRTEAAVRLLEWLRSERGVAHPAILKADDRFAAECSADGRFLVEAQRDHFDYVYSSLELAALAGRKFHSKKNHLNRFLKQFPEHEYRALDADLVPACLDVLDVWCRMRGCGKNPVLKAEAEAIHSALADLVRLDLMGGVILVAGRVEAFTFGELLNPETVVVHVEKANPDFPDLFTAINRRFCEASSGVPWINREQDLGEPGLRRSKLSYQPVRLIEKHRITMR